MIRLNRQGQTSPDARDSKEQITRFVLRLFILMAVCSIPLLAVDGVVLIDHARAMAGNITPGDAPGYPVTISTPGSYRLSGNLTVPNATTHAIVLLASHVSIDLNGFSILGPVDCAGGFPCAGEIPGSQEIGSGIFGDGPLFNIAIRNGTIQGMNWRGISIRGDSILVENIHARSNARDGIFLFPASSDSGFSIVQHCTAQRNGSGITLARGRATNNVVNTIRNFGIHVYGDGLIADNILNRADITIVAGANVLVRGNVLRDYALAINGGVSNGTNLCDGAFC